jgi:phage tail sheath protein FI
MTENNETLFHDIRTNAEPVLEQFIFEVNDSTTRSNVETALSAFLDTYIADKQIDDYAVLCNEQLNDQQRIDRNELWASMAVKPTGIENFTLINCRVTSGN